MPQTRSVSWSLVVTRHPGQSELRARRGRVSTRGASERVFDRQGLHSTAVHGGSSANASRRNPASGRLAKPDRSEEHTSELQSLMRISYAGFCLKKKKHRYSDKK